MRSEQVSLKCSLLNLTLRSRAFVKRVSRKRYLFLNYFLLRKTPIANKDKSARTGFLSLLSGFRQDDFKFVFLSIYSNIYTNRYDQVSTRYT